MRRPPRFQKLNDTSNTSYEEMILSPTRLRVFAVVIGAFIAILLSRLWYLQVLQGEELRGKVEVSRKRWYRETAPRGLIVDAKGLTLASNTAQFTVFIDPGFLPKDKAKRADILTELADVLGKTPDEIEQIMKRTRGGPSDPIPVAEGVDEHTKARIKESLTLIGVDVYPEPLRTYPNKSTAAHVLGYIGPVSQDDLKDPDFQKRGYHAGDLLGKSGIEAFYDPYLNGTEGGIWYETDAKGRRIRELDRQEPVTGATVRLTIDLKLQQVAERALGAHKGSVVALDPRDGRVLAMASFPVYDPNLFARRPLSGDIYREQLLPGLFDRATGAMQPPGSTFKIVTAAAGLATETIGQNTTFVCPGFQQFGATIRHCHSTHGGVNIVRAMAASCDVFFYQAAFRATPEKLGEWGDKFGLGQKTGIDLPSERAGYMPSPARHKIRSARYGNDDDTWYPGFTWNTSIGQGDVLATPLQMALVVSAIANGGTVYAPRVVSEAVAADKSVVYKMTPQATHHLDLSAQQISLLAQSLRAVVLPGGTSAAAALPGIAVAGKSGSAELKGQKGKGEHSTDAWFVCYAPFEKPTIAICVYLESDTGQNLHGGKDAAPIARQVLASYFGVRDTGAAETSTID